MSERMSARGGSYTFLDRHPESVLLPCAAFFGFTAYLNIATVVISRGSVGAAWLPSALAGAAFGIGVLAVIVLRFRAGRVGWFTVTPLVLVIVGLLSTREAVWAVPDPPGLVTTGFENAELALCAVSSFGVVLWFGWIYRMTGENRMMAKRSARVGGGDLHISRAGAWRDSAANPIRREEWEELAERSGLGVFDRHSEQAREDQINDIVKRRGLDRAGAEKWLARRVRRVQETQEFLASRPALIAKYPDEVAALLPVPAAPRRTFTLARPDGSRLTLQWNDSQVTVMGAGPDLAADAALLSPLARALEARVYNESGALLSADA